MSPAFRPNSLLARLSHAISPTEKRNLPPPPGIVAYSGLGIASSFPPETALRAYSDNVWLYGAVNKVAFEIAKTDFRLHKPTSDGFQEIESHQALETMKRPQMNKNGKTILTGFDLKFLSALHFLLAGEAFWVLDKRLKINGSPTRIDVALPHLISPRIDQDTGDLVGYWYMSAKGQMPLAPEDVVHFKMPDPLNPYRGHAPTQALRYAIDTHQAAERLNLHRIHNNAIPPVVLKPKNKIDPDSAARLRTQWDSLHGGERNAGRAAVLPQDMDIQELSQSNQDMQYVEGQGMNRDAVLGTYTTGPEMFGKTESQTRANAETAVFIFEKFGVLPFLTKWNDTLTYQFLPEFSGVKEEVFWFKDPVPENLEEKRANIQARFNMGAASPNDVLTEFGEEVRNEPGMDKTYIPFNLVPVDAPAPAPPLTGLKTNTEAGKNAKSYLQTWTNSSATKTKKAA